MKAGAKEGLRAAYPLVLIFVLLVAGIVTAGGLYCRHYEQHFRAAAEHQLLAIAELKVSELVQYRKERLEDAAMFFNNTAFSGLVRRFFEHPEDADAQQQIQEWMVKVMATDQYDLVRLLDTQGVTCLSAPPGRPPLSSFVAQHIPEVLQSGQVTLQDFHWNEHDRGIRLTLLVPILDESNTNRPLGILALRINPEIYLYPFIQRWPVPSKTAETLLVRRDGNDVLYLNELRFQTNSALNLRISLKNTNVAEVKAVLGQEGIVESTDYRGAPVLAALHAVPDSPWFLVARMDTTEVFAPMRARLWQVVVIICALLFGSAAWVGLIWRHQRARFYQAQYESAEALRRSETKFHTLYDSNRDAVMLLDTKGFFDCNQATLTMFGCATREEFYPKHPADLSPPIQPDGKDSLTLANQWITTALEKGSAHFEWMHKRVNTGEIFPADVLLSAMELDGKPVLQAVVRDITERKQAEKALREEQTLSATLMDNLPDAIYFKDAASRFLRANRTHSNKFSLSEPAQLVGKSDADFFSSEHAQKALADEQEIIRTGRPLLNVEEKETWPDGTVTWALTTKLPLHDETGQVIGTCGISRDITERKQVEEKLRQLSQAVEQSPASIVITNPAGDIEYVNPKFVDLTGYTLAEALGKNPRILKSGDKGPEEYRELWKTIMAGKEWRGEFHNKKKNGELYWESASISSIRDSTGHITHFLAVKEDITARKQTEAERDQLIQELKDALARVKSLSGLLPICAGCKKIRDDKGYWSQVESYIQQHSEAKFSHGLCPDCIKKLYPDMVVESSPSKSPKKAP